MAKITNTKSIISGDGLAFESQVGTVIVGAIERENHMLKGLRRSDGIFS